MTQETELELKDGLKNEPLLSVENLKISFVTRAGVIQAINGVSFQISSGETLGLVGETGCGKSQTAFSIMRLTPQAGIIQEGRILLGGIDLTKNIAKEMKVVHKRGGLKLERNKSALKRMNAEMSKIRGKEVSIIFQEPMTSLNPVYKIRKQISEVLMTHSVEDLIDRIIARNSTTPAQLRSLAETFFESSRTKKDLHTILETENLEPLEDQLWQILSRQDLGQEQKLNLILNLDKNKVSPSAINFLYAIKKSKGQIPISYQLLSRVPVLRRNYLGVLQKEADMVSFELLSSVRMPNAESVLKQYPHELSGGMRQRVMIAMAIAAKPKLLIADEPTSALDVTVQAQILELLGELKISSNTSILFISHDMGIIADICDRVGVMYAGNLVEIGDIFEIFRNPKHPYTQGLLATIPKYGEKQETLDTIPGSVPNLMVPPSGCRFVSRCPHAFEKCSSIPPWVEVKNGHAVFCWLFEKNIA